MLAVQEGSYPTEVATASSQSAGSARAGSGRTGTYRTDTRARRRRGDAAPCGIGGPRERTRRSSISARGGSANG